jgi:rubrerythrin
MVDTYLVKFYFTGYSNKIIKSIGKSPLIKDLAKKAAEAFEQSGKVEKIHLKHLKEVLKEGTDDSANYYVRQICGYITVGRVP